MTPQDFANWCALMAERHGWCDLDVARQLGCGRNSPRTWRTEGAPLYVALACAALANDLTPWKS